MEHLTDLKDIVIISKPFIDPIISTLITPQIEKLKSFLKKKEIENKVVENFFENKFEEYLYQTYKKCSIINVLVFPNQQIKIKDIYIPLSIKSSKDHTSQKINTFDKKYIEKYNNILISDNAGMGKSTLTKWISLSLIEQSLSIPILIELKKINSKHDILSEIFNQINPIDKSFDQELILKFLQLGNFTILFDGFDEVEYQERLFVIKNIKEIIAKASKNWFVLTSRPDPELTAFGEFQLFNIEPLAKKESFNLIEKYDKINNNHLSKDLKEDIELKFNQVKEFLTNPFLVSLLYKTYTYNKDIPSKKSTFYEEVYSALYKHHDLSKDGFKRNKKSKLDIYDFKIVLRALAFDTAKIIKIDYKEDELIELIKDTKKHLTGIEFKELNYIEDLEFNVPIFVREGNILKWAHKSLQDYFAAEFICNHPKKEEIITRLYESKKSNYLQILNFILELDLQTFRHTVIYNFLNKYINYCKTSYQGYNIPIETIRDRQSLTFGILYGIIPEKNIKNWVGKLNKVISEDSTDFYINTISAGPNKFGSIFEFYATSYNQELINTIGAKSKEFVKEVKNSDKIPPLQIKPYKSKTILISDDPKSKLNHKNIFKLVNNRIFSFLAKNRTQNKAFVLDYDKCVSEIEKIEIELNLKNQADIFDGI